MEATIESTYIFREDGDLADMPGWWIGFCGHEYFVQTTGETLPPCVKEACTNTTRFLLSE